MSGKNGGMVMGTNIRFLGGSGWFQICLYVICGVNVPDEYLKGTRVRSRKIRMKLTPTNRCLWRLVLVFPNFFQAPIPSIRSPSISLPQERVRSSKTRCEVLFFAWMSYTLLFGLEKCQVFDLPFCWNQARFQRCKNRFNLASWEWSYYNHPPTKEQETCHPSSRFVPGPLGKNGKMPTMGVCDRKT